MLETYRRFGLEPFLKHLRQDHRYSEANGQNLLTTCTQPGPTWKQDVYRTLESAEMAGYKAWMLAGLECAKTNAQNHPMGANILLDVQMALEKTRELADFKNSLSPGVGLAQGLNPYTDWTLKNIGHKPRGWVIVLGADWYPISALNQGEDWFTYLRNPFADWEDFYWPKVWGWMLNRLTASGTTWGGVSPQQAAEYMASHQIGVIFHNPIPYLRAPGVGKSDDDWLETEMGNKRLLSVFVEDLGVLRDCVPNSVAVCTSKRTSGLLSRAGFRENQIHCWKGHPAQPYFSCGTIKLSMENDVLPSLETAITQTGKFDL